MIVQFGILVGGPYRKIFGFLYLLMATEVPGDNSFDSRVAGVWCYPSAKEFYPNAKQAYPNAWG